MLNYTCFMKADHFSSVSSLVHSWKDGTYFANSLLRARPILFDSVWTIGFPLGGSIPFAGCI